MMLKKIYFSVFLILFAFSTNAEEIKNNETKVKITVVYLYWEQSDTKVEE